ncbi:hypothetical protein [Microvirga pakistanensis]|uniref:hypothetical protein n=1 Tax=Microvirga pakistanensis TaxID=1682650 RepID=UPI00106DCDBF|nr:hypothetical protein [Microvirga pakistanensis]
MTRSHVSKGGARYRYYVSQALLQRRKESAGSVSRVPAPELEQAVVKAVRTRLPQAKADASDPDVVSRFLERVIVQDGALEIIFRGDEESEPGSILIPWSRPRHTRKRDLIVPKEAGEGILRPIRPEARTKLLLSIARGRAWVDELMSGQVASTHAIATREGLSERSIRMTLSLAFLAPDLVTAAVEGRLTRGMGVTSFAELPSDWTEQRRLLGSEVAKEVRISKDVWRSI